MKKKLAIWSLVVVAVVTAGIAIARADAPFSHGWHHHGPWGFIAHELDLTDAQKAQAKSIWQGERGTVAGLVRELAAESKEMDTVTAQGNFNEEKVQEISGRQAATIAKLLMEKQKIQTQLYANVLTPEQRAKADKFHARFQDHLEKMADHIQNGGSPHDE